MQPRLPRPRLPTRADLDDDGVLIGIAAGALWAVGSLGAAIASLLPSSDGAHPVARWTVLGFALAYGSASIFGVIDFRKVTIDRHFVIGLAMMPVLGAGVWATGGSGSYVMPLLLPVLAHEAFFFPWRHAIVLNAMVVGVTAAPLAYESHPLGAYPGRLVTFAIAAVLLTVTLRLLKDRLVAAESRQRRMALSDPLTGLANRRAFDAALAAATATCGDPDLGRRASDEAGFALVLFDLDGFKGVNDTFGHLAGDRLLCEVAARCSAVVRDQDTLARIGGDEFAVVAPGAAQEGAERLAEALQEAIAEAGARASVAWAVCPLDARDAEDLLREADRRLYASKGRAAYDAAQWA